VRGSLAAVGAVTTILLLAACTSATTAGPGTTSPSGTTPPVTTTATTPSAVAESVALRWPVTTLAQAIELQQAVDAGRQPWLLDPSEVAIAYASAELGMTSPQAVRSSTGVVDVREGTGGRVVTVTLVQPVRKALGGIWVVTASR
jgi:hypothetical protein